MSGAQAFAESQLHQLTRAAKTPVLLCSHKEAGAHASHLPGRTPPVSLRFALASRTIDDEVRPEEFRVPENCFAIAHDSRSHACLSMYGAVRRLSDEVWPFVSVNGLMIARLVNLPDHCLALLCHPDFQWMAGNDWLLLCTLQDTASMTVNALNSEGGSNL